ncbi:MAG TPA: outer membrane protein assembly factor BamD, partial [Ramlibacter sp.]
ALVILVRSYDALNMPQLRDDSRRVLEKTYPQSAFITGRPAAGSKAASPWWKFW